MRKQLTIIAAFLVVLAAGCKNQQTASSTESQPVSNGAPNLSNAPNTAQASTLSPEDLGRLFGRFQRLSAKPTAGESSTGLGLSIVKRIIDMHGGEVTAESRGPNKGSTFTIVLPATDLP